MNRITYILFVSITSLSSLCMQAQGYNEAKALDTIVEKKAVKAHIQEVDHKQFQQLYNKHYPQQLISKPIYDIKQVEELLGDDFTLGYEVYQRENDSYNNYPFYYLEKRNIYRSMTSEAEFLSYYPKERILTYMYGNSVDGAIDVDTGEDAPYFPQYATLSADSVYFMRGEHDGIETTYYTLYKLDANTQKYVKQYSMSEVLDGVAIVYIWHFSRSFWVENTFYFVAGYIDDDDDLSTHHTYSITIL